MNTTSKLARIISISLLSVAGFVFAADHPAPSVNADAALVKLKEGNARFATSTVSEGKPTAAKRAETAQTQHPFAIIVGCADSRTPPELVFDQNIGDLFVVRTAGNLVDDHGLGSIEYAVKHLGARLIVVLGHQRCGAVSAALASDSAPGHIQSLVRDIQPAVKAAKSATRTETITVVDTTAPVIGSAGGDATIEFPSTPSFTAPTASDARGTSKVNFLDLTITENARLIAAKIRSEVSLGELAKEVRIVYGVYSFDTGKVEWAKD